MTRRLDVRYPGLFTLLGYDMQCGDDGAIHWHGAHRAGMSNPDAPRMARWRELLDAQAGRLQELGAVVVNASERSALTGFTRLPIGDVLNRWNACPSISTTPEGRFALR